MMNVVREYDEKALLMRVAQGDEDAFGVLFHQHRHKILYFAWKFLQSDSRAQDVVQEIFLKVWVSREQLGDIKNFKAWLTAITRNHIYNALRRLAVEESFKSRLSANAGLQDENTVLDDLSFKELQYALQKAVSHLTPQQRKIFELSRMEGMKHEQIAEKLGISRDTVKKHITDALRHIRLEMNSPEKLVQLTILLIAVRL
jgi:RNA polymerase sigma-70 factor (ECF subfamily)